VEKVYLIESMHRDFLSCLLDARLREPDGVRVCKAEQLEALVDGVFLCKTVCEGSSLLAVLALEMVILDLIQNPAGMRGGI
jgi:hypothetical protein